MSDKVKIEDIRVSAYTIPTDAPEADGTLKWNSTTLVLVELAAGGKNAIGYTYADASAAYMIQHTLTDLIKGKNAFQNTAITENLIRHIRNSGTCGISMMAVSAVDNALWDLKAKLLDIPLCTLLGKVRDEMLVYGSGGFTSYSRQQLQDQLKSWSESGMKHVKMKIGENPDTDIKRVKQAREAISQNTELFVDANGAYDIKQALEKASAFKEYNVTWFEEPVKSSNLKGLHFIREHAPAIMNVAAGEYGFNFPYFQQMLHAEAVDVLQADATRCGGITNFLKAGYLCEAYQMPFSSHCAPSLHLHAALAIPSFYIAEYFHDHVRIESMLFDGFCAAQNGKMKPDESRPGIGIVFKYQDAKNFNVINYNHGK